MSCRWPRVWDRGWKKCLWGVFLCGVILVVTVPHPWSLLVALCTGGCGGERGISTDPDEYAWVIDALQKEDLGIENRCAYRMDRARQCLIRQAPYAQVEENRTGRIVAMKKKDGRTLFSIVTNDQHHAGVYGLVYSSAEASREEMKEIFGGEPLPDASKISDHWWKVYDGSN